MLRRLNMIACLCVLSGTLALTAMAMELSFLLIFACMCIATASAFALLSVLMRQRHQLDAMNTTLGHIMRGELHARLHPHEADDALSRLQHRINNLLDALDLHVRGTDAAIDAAEHAEYIEKLKQSGLYIALHGEPTLATRPDEERVTSLLQQLGHDVAGLFNDEAPVPKDDCPPVDAALDVAQLEARQHALHAIVEQLHAACTELSQRAAIPASSGAAPSPATLEAGLTRVAEQATVIGFNVAIEANRAGDASPLHGLGEELRNMAALAQKIRGEVAASLAPHHRKSQPLSVPLASVIETLVRAEQAVREEAQQLHALVAEDAPAMLGQAA